MEHGHRLAADPAVKKLILGLGAVFTIVHRAVAGRRGALIKDADRNYVNR
jgi:hypothetical protein